MSKKNKKLDREYFEKKKNPKYDDQEAYTKCCNQLKDGNHMMKGNKDDWKLIEESKMAGRWLKEALGNHFDGS